MERDGRPREGRREGLLRYVLMALWCFGEQKVVTVAWSVSAIESIFGLFLRAKAGDSCSRVQRFLDRKAYRNALIIPRAAEMAENAEEEQVVTLPQLLHSALAPIFGTVVA